MKNIILSIILFISISACGKKTNSDSANKDINTSNLEYIVADVYDTSKGKLKITLVGHGSLMFQFAGKTIHIDPYSKVADYSNLPKADLIILTHEHADHLDADALKIAEKNDTHFIVSPTCAEILTFGNIISNGESTSWSDISIDAVPAYNLVNKSDGGDFYHPKGRGNGYIFTFGDKKVYVAGDTENIPEMDNLIGTIDIAFLPKNVPYTMNDDMFIDAVIKIEPKVLYPYHMAEFDEEKISAALSSINTEIKIRTMSNK